MPGSHNNKNMASQDDLMAIALSQSASERALDAGAGEVPPGGPDFTKLGFGCWQLGSKGADDYWGLEFTDEMADDLVRLAVERGILYMDTAEGYADGASEAQLGRALAKLPAAERARVLVGTKILPNSCGEVRAHVEQMRERLQVDCIDLVMIHWPITVEGMAHFAGDHKTASGGHDYATSDAASVGEVPSTQVSAQRKVFALDCARSCMRAGVPFVVVVVALCNVLLLTLCE